MLVVTLIAVEPLWQRLIDAAIALVVVAGALTVIRDGRAGRIRLLGGELAIDAAFAYVVVALASRPVGAPLRSVELVLGLGGLVTGAGALAVAPLDDGSVAAAVRRSVLLITGTILIALAVGQLEHPGLSMRWNWVPFLGFAVPGMLTVLGAELLRGSAASRGRTLATTVALVAGVAILLYGSINNLALGQGGLGAGIRATPALSAAAAATAALVAGGSLSRRWRPAWVSDLITAAGVLGMVVTERIAVLHADVGVGPLPAAVSRGLPVLAGGLIVVIALPALQRCAPALIDQAVGPTATRTASTT